VAVIIVHHAGKSGDQRGASSLEDFLDNTIELTKIKGMESGGHFNVKFTKGRSDDGEMGFKPFQMHLIEHEDNARWIKWVTE
jgi:putative DNA primase/helicase